jgi:hypothetical protein
MHCNVHGCNQPPVAKGYCAKHYMRVRRQGDPNKLGEAGRPYQGHSSLALLVYSIDCNLSERTQRRLFLAYDLLMAVGGYAAWDKALVLASRDNGNVNYAKLLRIAECWIAKARPLYLALPQDQQIDDWKWPGPYEYFELGRVIALPDMSPDKASHAPAPEPEVDGAAAISAMMGATPAEKLRSDSLARSEARLAGADKGAS